MANSYFQFKQFTIWHDQCAMKVGTDSVLLGAWTDFSNATNILDIGTGTGILALMAAQKAPQAIIDAIEIDAAAVVQAQENISQSRWENRITVYHKSLQKYAIETNKKYDVIISNPPYFQRALKSPNQQRTIARHDNHLDIYTLLKTAYNLLKTNGRINIILPVQDSDSVIHIAMSIGLGCCHQTFVRPTQNAHYKRCLLCFSNILLPYKQNELTIETSVRHIFTDEYKQITKDFYLNF
ncbi:tRNA1(Val) (adenine(37)-N6)-methyltransferase [Microbacter margulisiae]|uniref:tRNA1(Val) (adenine(37)-N6)-methyltransferase n=1 Tax=Microbacter margulisiae TaxID=1350067 RepID=A0A7W5DSK0_9PORP|nr:methyltransferase [Microbacter margulisiae]MBB3187995.1 tRNA1Val (adenine37-N6)-methyltransferase [Microbacter margulisiae]